MSYIFDMSKNRESTTAESGMTADEKNTWIYLGIAMVVPAVYAAVITGRAGAAGGVERVEYAPMLIAAIVSSVVKIVRYRRGF